MIHAKQQVVYINSVQKHALSEFSAAFEKQLMDTFNTTYHDIVIMCIGTDRSTGDSLGPLVGHKLSNLKYPHIAVYGTLHQPVHAKNLKDTLEHIHTAHTSPFIIAIDACLGSLDHVGYISISKDPLRPGASMNKDLPAVGNLAIAGIVNLSGFMDFLMLQNTRLSLVMDMAELISLGLKYVLWKKYDPLLNVPLNMY